LGEKITDKFPLHDFWTLLCSIQTKWNEAVENIKKIELKKEKRKC